MYCNQNASAKTSSIILGDYQFLPDDKIARGFSSCVYAGHHRNTNANVAIKSIDLKSIKTGLMKTLLENQIEALSLLRDSKRVIKCKEIRKEENFVYFVTEKYENGDLDKLIKQHKIDNDQIQRLMIQLIEGYLQIAKKKIIHRDIKPSNIFLDSKNQIVIGDFGFSIKQTQEQKKYAYNVGSLHFISPQALIDNIYGPKSDIWALGITIYQIINKKTPWRGKSQKQLVNVYKNAQNQFNIYEGLDVPDKVILFLKKTIIFNPQQRMGLSQLRQFFEQNQYVSQNCCQTRIGIQTEQKYKNTESDQQNSLSNLIEVCSEIFNAAHL